MAFNSNTGEQAYIASAGQTEFDFNFKIFNNTDVLVYLTPDGQVPNDTTDILLLTTNYTVIITDDAGGKATLNIGASINDTIVIRRNLPQTRPVEYQTSGDMLSATVNDDQDYQTYLILDQTLTNSKSIRLPNTAIGVDTLLPNVIGDAYLRWNTAGTTIENDTTIPDAVGQSAASAAAALVSENAAALSETNAATSESNAAASAASINLPAIIGGDTGKILKVNVAEDGYDLVVSSEFKDDEFTLLKNTDITKKLSFSLAALTANRSITIQDKSGTLAFTEDIVPGGNVGSKTVNESAIGDDKIIVYKSGADEFVYEEKPTTPAAGILHIEHREAAGTNGGTLTAGAWQKRPNTTIVTNTITGASLNGSDQFLLPVGTFDIEGFYPVSLVNYHKAKLLNFSDTVDELFSGGANVSGSATNDINSDNAIIKGRLIVTGSTKTFEIDHRVSTTRASLGMGSAVNGSFTVPYETYGITHITEVL